MKNKSKYVDKGAISQVIGILFSKPSVLNNDDKYKFSKDDFYDDFHKIVFSSIYNIYQLGAKEITLAAIEDYLTQRPKFLAEYKANKGPEYILSCVETANPQLMDYYYQRIKKLSLMRAYEAAGMDLSWLLDKDNIMDIKKKQEQEDRFDNMSLQEIADTINNKIDAIRNDYIDAADVDGMQLGAHADEILDELSRTPALGYPFYTRFMNTITRGMRPGKFYLRSAPTGVGKSRSMIADACWLGCSEIYDEEQNQWIDIGVPQSTLYIATEQDETEVTTMALAFISGVDEERILMNSYLAGEKERVSKAVKILQKGKLFFTCIPDFGIQNIESIIKKYIREKSINYAFFDYIHTSPKILTEIGGKSGVKNLREDNVLFLLSSALKDICVKYDIFILSSTQLNASYAESETPNEACLRGSKAIADRIDVGMLMLEVTKEDKEKLLPFVQKNGIEMPNLKISVYKNRGNRYKSNYLWLYADRGTCRFKGAFVSTWFYEILDIPDIKIKVAEEGAF